MSLIPWTIKLNHSEENKTKLILQQSYVANNDNENDDVMLNHSDNENK